MKSRRDFVRENQKEPYKLKLENPPEGHVGYVVFQNANRLSTGTSFALAGESDPEVILRTMLSEEDYDLWFEEWREVPIEETNGLLEDVQDYYGANRGKRRS